VIRQLGMGYQNRFVGVLTYGTSEFRVQCYQRKATWRLEANAIITLQTGEPFNVVSLRQANISQPNGISNDPTSFTSSADQVPTKITSTKTPCIDGSASAVLCSVYLRHIEQNAIHGPGTENVNFSLFKDFSIWREARFQIRGELPTSSTTRTS